MPSREYDDRDRPPPSGREDWARDPGAPHAWSSSQAGPQAGWSSQHGAGLGSGHAMSRQAAYGSGQTAHAGGQVWGEPSESAAGRPWNPARSGPGDDGPTFLRQAGPGPGQAPGLQPGGPGCGDLQPLAGRALGRAGGDPSPQETHFHDPDYRLWREEQLRNLDKDYEIWRQDRYRRFADEFNRWRAARQSGTTPTSGPGGNLGSAAGATEGAEGPGEGSSPAGGPAGHASPSPSSSRSQ